MDRKRKNRPTPRGQTKPTIVRTHLAVIAGIKRSPKGPDVRKEVELVKASLLYADTIEILSVGGIAVRQMVEFSKQSPSMLWHLLAGLDDSTLEHLGVSDVAKVRSLLPWVASIDPDQLRTLASSTSEMAPLGKLARLLEQGNATATESMAKMGVAFEDMRDSSGLKELESVLDNKIVRFNERVSIGAAQEMLDTFTVEFKRYLTDPNRFVLLDDEMASMARAMIREGVVRPPDRSFSNAGEAVLGAGLLARLPAFTSVPLVEVLELRRDLEEPLARYRRRVAQLRGEMRGTPFDQHVEAEVNAAWRTEVDPAIADIREAMADHSLVREIVRSFRRSAGDVLRGWAPVGLGVTVAKVADFDMAVTAAIATGAVATQAVVDALEGRSQGRQRIRAHDFYYLYEVDRRAT